MRPAFRTVPTAGPRTSAAGHRLATTLAVLLAVLLAMVPAHTAHAASGPRPDPAVAATSAQLADTGPRADDKCAVGCTPQARTRHDPLGERPGPTDHHATDPGDVAVGRPAVGARTSAASAHPLASPCRSAHDRGRAPPAPTGT
ncbi:hypothetical protein [Streptomyces coerulescens]|uniref:Secreted protein n=1 Tax=Streptomyces coerulescens TaxID=29304 RepID=A0ABW0CV78_STRCD